MNMKAKVNNILMTAKGNKYDVYYTLCDEYITENDEPYVVLKQILEFSDKIGVDDDSEPSNISLTEIKGIEEKYTSLIVEISEVLAEENLEEDEYYKKLYDAIFLSNFLPRTKKTQATFLKILCENVRVVPYYQATNLVKLSNDEFATTFEKLKPHIIKAMHMLNRNFDTMTEVTSQIYQIEKSITDEQEKIVFLSFVFGFLIRKRNNEDND